MSMFGKGTSLDDPVIVFRPPSLEDGRRMWQLVRDIGTLDLNSPYCYLLLCHHFSDTCVVAESGDSIVGFVSAYRPPAQKGVLFVWQVGVSATVRGRGLASQMLRELLNRDACRGVKCIETTVSPSNTPSRALFHSFAHHLHTDLAETEGFGRALFPGVDHESEPLFRIGPFEHVTKPD